MAHVGYDLELGPLTLRPSLGLGFAQQKAEAAGESSVPPDYASHVAASPGVEALVGWGLMTLSAEARHNLVINAAPDAVIVGLGLGLRL